jgi:hypothetical protein
MNITKTLVTSLCILGSTLSYGLLGYSGMMHLAGRVIFGFLMPSVMFPYAIGAFFFGIAVECAVYKISIREGAAVPDNLEVTLKRTIAEREIKKLSNTPFGRFYARKSKRLEHLLKLQNHYDKGLINPCLYDDRDKQRIEKEVRVLQRTLRHMKSALIQSIQINGNYPPGLSEKILRNEHVILKEELNQEISRTVNRYGSLVKLFTYGAGVVQGLITVGNLIAVFGCPPVTIIIAMLAGGGCLYQMRGALTDAVVADWKERINGILPHDHINEGDGKIEKICKKIVFFFKMTGVVVVVLGVVALSLVALIAGAEAWVKFTTGGLQSIPYLIKAGGKAISVFAKGFVALLLLPSLVFNVTNGVEACFDLLEKFKNFFVRLWRTNISHYFKTVFDYLKNRPWLFIFHDFYFIFLKNLFQLINPFALCLKVFSVVLLIGHSIVNGLASDESEKISLQVNMVTNTGVEFIGDANFVLASEDDDEHEYKHEKNVPHGHGDHIDDHDHKQEHHQHHSHHHHNDKGFIFNFIEDVLRSLSFGWDVFFGSLFTCNLTTSFGEAQKKFFPVKSLNEADASVPESLAPMKHEINGVKDLKYEQDEQLNHQGEQNKLISHEMEDDKFEKEWLEFQIKRQLDNKVSKLEKKVENEKNSQEKENDSTSLISRRLTALQAIKKESEGKDIASLRNTIKCYSDSQDFSHRHQVSEAFSVFCPSFKPKTRAFLESLVDTIDYLPKSQAQRGSLSGG